MCAIADFACASLTVSASSGASEQAAMNSVARTSSTVGAWCMSFSPDCRYLEDTRVFGLVPAVPEAL